MFFVLAGAAAVGGVSTFRVGGEPTVRIEPGLPAIGPKTPVVVQVEEPKRGLVRVDVELVQGDKTHLIASREHTPQPPWALWAQGETQDRMELEVGRESIESLKNGEATLRVTAARAGTWLYTPEPVVASVTLPVRLRPPSVIPKSEHVYVTQGGCEVVVYEVGETAIRHGVRAGKWWFPGYPLPNGKENERFALFAAPYDSSDVSQIRLEVEDDVGNIASTPFVDQFTKKPFSEDTIKLSTPFMNKVVPRILANTDAVQDQGDLVKTYVEINSKLRAKNAQELIDMSKESKAEFLWRRPFVQMEAKVMSSFADRRSYVFEGKVVDTQDHLGFDLASTSQAEVPASNRGVVLLAGYFGIYGNTVILDHGFGLTSLYAHLSSVDVKQGDTVERGQTVGRTGATGLAGGDHLHFTMLLHGLAVNPIEWWDGHWIHDRLKLKLRDALDFES